MKAHIDDTTIIRVLSETATGDETAYVQGHIATCEKCRATYETLHRLFDGKTLAIEPSARVKEGVLLAWDKASQQKAKNISRTTVYRVASWLSAAAVILLIVTAALFFTSSNRNKNFEYTLVASKGITSIDGVRAEKSQKLSLSSIIETSENAVASIQNTAGYHLTVAPSSRVTFTIDQSHKTITGTLAHGMIISSSHGKTRYAYESQGFRITPAGTVFFVRAENKIVSAGVKEGSITVTRDGVTVMKEISAGKIWNSDTADRILDMRLDENGFFGKMNAPVSSQSIASAPVSNNPTKEGTAQQQNASAQNPEPTKENDRTPENAQEIEREKNRTKQDQSDAKQDRREKRNGKRERGGN